MAMQPGVWEWPRTKTDDWCGREDLNLHTLRVHAPQACASANSATTANLKRVQTRSHTYLNLVRLPNLGGRARSIQPTVRMLSTLSGRLYVDQPLHRRFTCGRTCLHERFASRFEAHPTAHAHSFLVDCPTGDSLHTGGVWPTYGGTTIGQRPYTTLLRTQTR